MRIIADFHLHSKYSRATSSNMDIENMSRWAKIKGVNVLGTGDFTHPLWLKELKEKLEEAENGLYKLKKKNFLNKYNNLWSNFNNQDELRFILTTEISCVYSKNNKTRKIHLVILAPSFEMVEKINSYLSWVGNLKADGRPILGMDAKELLKIVLNTCPDCMIIPAHIYTPWFSLFGANSGFDSIEECFEEYSKYIYAGETGLSSDPEMSWRNSSLDNITLVSNSDAHSPNKIGREANIFEGEELSYKNIINAIKIGKNADESCNFKLVSTIEFYPEEGKYHFDGHRNCNVCLSPEEAKKLNNICPKCGKPLTIGVCHRIEDLSDRPKGGRPEKVIPFLKLVPLEEIIAEALGVKSSSKAVFERYKELINYFGNEFKVLLDASIEKIEQVSLPEIAEGIRRVREGKVYISPGYDGEYGKIKIFKEGELENFSKKQASLF